MVGFYRFLENNTPQSLKRVVPEAWRIWLGYQIKVRRRLPVPTGSNSIPKDNGLIHPLSLPPGETEQTLHDYLSAYSPEDGGGKDELRGYLGEAFKRFLYTLQLVPDGEGKLLEIGANPYFMTLLLRKFRRYELHTANFFGIESEPTGAQTIVSATDKITFNYAYVNIERDPLPFEDNYFDVVLFCEVLEHFTNDPQKALLDIRRVLKPGGLLVLTTPNVARLSNVAQMIAGGNFYDPYSGYGPYGRHNREYNRRELARLLEHVGFSIDEIFTSDVHPNHDVPNGIPQLVEHRKKDWGQYIFVRAVKGVVTVDPKKPGWLYRSYPPGELED